MLIIYSLHSHPKYRFKVSPHTLFWRGFTVVSVSPLWAEGKPGYKLYLDRSKCPEPVIAPVPYCLLHVITCMGNTPDQREIYPWSAKIGTPDQPTPDQLSLVQRKFVRLISVAATLDSHQDGWSGARFHGWSGVADQAHHFTLIRSTVAGMADQEYMYSDWSGVADQAWLIRRTDAPDQPS